MYLLDARRGPIAQLRSTLAGLGDSLVVVGGEGLWNVHVHVDDVGAAIEAGIEAGRPHRVRVTHFAEQVAAREPRPRVGRAIVAVAAGPGLAGLFEEAGAVVVSRRPGQPALDRDAARGDRSGRARTRSSSCPTTTTRCGRRRSRPAPPRRTTTCGSR